MIENQGEDNDETALFRAAMQDVAPLPAPNKITHNDNKPAPYPRKKFLCDEIAPNDSLSDHISFSIETGDPWSYVRSGMPHQTLRRLRRGHWNIEKNLDLHGYTQEEARQQLSAFLNHCVQQKMRCVRVIHGKGLSSLNREPVLKNRIGNWLIQRTEVLAFCQAKPEDGGGGAVLILLKTVGA